MAFSFLGLPAPVRQYARPTEEPAPMVVQKAPVRTIPGYSHRVSSKFQPKTTEDYGDGGAYPEIHISQFPLGMGSKDKISDSNVLALQVNDNGRAQYDAIVKKKNQLVYSSFNDVVEKVPEAEALAKPTLEEEIETAAKTKAALDALVSGKVAAAHPINVSRQKSVKETSTYIRYTPHDQGFGDKPPEQRIIRMVEAPVDPIQPPKYKHKKAVRGPGSPPVPVLHSPPRKLTVQDQQAWKIPPCISNWKNAKGYTIALDKRLAADGRGLQKVTVNNKFASLAESLAIAERKAREEISTRGRMQKLLDEKHKQEKEQQLREKAASILKERSGGQSRKDESDGSDDDDDPQARRERDKLRYERRREREREMRLENLMGKKGKLARDEDRDVSEKIALGQLQGGKGASGAQFDSRLFNQSQGMDSGFGNDDEYNVYSKALMDRGKASVYRPKADAEGVDGDKDFNDLKSSSTKRFRADKGFQGTDHTQTRSGPVQFAYDEATESHKRERSDSRERRRSNSRDLRRSRSHSRDRKRRRVRSSDREDDSKDPFDVDRFLTDARRGNRR
ncbi:puff-specific protein Bx42-like [Thraustotheca clavata]|uniref:Puff-specific protein Bx42-like n=1 Tax=Thraustotheca clavata TaxID=74557 RepID=A0A1V9YZV9_9STRA|nr:puff-specific protein Bx42-like [Thraustotheca clavata]